MICVHYREDSFIVTWR